MPWRRIILAVLCGVTLGTVLARSLGQKVFHAVRLAVFDVTQHEWLAFAVGVLAVTVPGPLIAAYIAASGTRRDPETRCRKYGYILRGISEPRCPECGERI